jgi:hypothetical protein
VIHAAHAAGRKIGICGQAPSDYPEFARFLVTEGIDSLSLNPDSLLKTMLAVVGLDKTIGKNASEAAREQKQSPAQWRARLHQHANGGWRCIPDVDVLVTDDPIPALGLEGESCRRIVCDHGLRGRASRPSVARWCRL